MIVAIPVVTNVDPNKKCSTHKHAAASSGREERTARAMQAAETTKLVKFIVEKMRRK